MIDLVYLENKHHVYANTYYFDVLKKYDFEIQSLGINYNRPNNPVYMHMILYALFYIFSNEHTRALPLPKDDQTLFILGIIAQHKFNPTDVWDHLTYGDSVEQHYKMWRYFFTTLSFINDWKHAENFLMFAVDFAFYFDNAFQRNILLMAIYDFLICGVMHKFNFNEILEVMKRNDFFEYLTRSLLWLEALKLSCIQKTTFDPNNIPEEAFRMICARLKVKAEYIDEITTYITNEQYEAALERAFYQPAEFSNYLLS